jgi:hypothetical protein
LCVILPESLTWGLCLEVSLISFNVGFDAVLFGFVVKVVSADLVMELGKVRSPACEVLRGPREDLSVS